MAEEKNINLPVTSFTELEDIETAREVIKDTHKDADMLPFMVGNIMTRPDIEDKAGAMTTMATQFMERVGARSNLLTKIKEAVVGKQERNCKTEGGVCLPASDFAFVPDPSKPSTWKLPLAEGRPGNITVKKLGAAAASFSAGGFRGNRVQLPSSAIGPAKARIRREYLKLGVKPDEIPDSAKEISFWKDKETNQVMWLTTYSNNFRDNDRPPEIISAESHRFFVKEVEEGRAPLPKLLLWHYPQWEWGQATAVAYDETGFAVAMGTVKEGLEEVATWVDSRDDLLVSHGMIPSSIERDSEDSTILIKHITGEISPLFADKAANKLTGFEVLKEGDDMAIPSGKREALLENGLSEEMLQQMEAKNLLVAQAAKENGIQTKEVEPEPKNDKKESEGDEVNKAIIAMAAQIGALTKEVITLKEEYVKLTAPRPQASLDAQVKGIMFPAKNELVPPIQAKATEGLTNWWETFEEVK